MAPKVKVTYFVHKGRAELIRLLLTYGGIEFEDIRIGTKEWPQIKPNTPFGQVPLYEEDGKVMWQSMAIARYIAKKVKLMGSNEWEDLNIDAVVDTIQDFRTKIMMYYRETNSNIKEVMKAPLFNETVPYYLQRLEKIAKENNGYLANSKLSWADIYFASIIDGMIFILGENITEKYPNLGAVKNNVLAIPSIQNWFDTCPKTDI